MYIMFKCMCIYICIFKCVYLYIYINNICIELNGAFLTYPKEIVIKTSQSNRFPNFLNFCVVAMTSSRDQSPEERGKVTLPEYLYHSTTICYRLIVFDLLLNYYWLPYYLIIIEPRLTYSMNHH